MHFAATLLASLVVSATALTTPQLHGLHHRHHHVALAKARAPAPEPAPQSFVASAAIPKRQLRKRCSGRKKHSPTSTSSDPSPTSTPAAASSPDVAPVNVAPLPDPSPTPDPPKASPSKDHASSQDHTSSQGPTSSQEPAPSSTPSSDNSQSSSLFTGSHVGDGTFYGTGLGACGFTNRDKDNIVAVSEALFDAYPGYNGGDPNSNPVCGKRITATYQGKSTTVTVTDRCTGCSPTSLDFSPNAFNQLADPSIGRLHDVEWKWD